MKKQKQSKQSKPKQAFGAIVSFDFIELLERITGEKGWKEVNGPDSRCGLDYWYKRGKGTEAYINIDQDAVTVSIDGDRIWEGETKDINWHAKIG